MIWVTFDVSTGGSLTNLEKTWNPGAQTLIFLELNDRSVNSSWMAFRMTLSRAASCEPSNPSGFKPNSLSRRVPDSFGSNSAILRLPAPKSRHKNDFVFSIKPVVLRKNNPSQATRRSGEDVKVFAGY